MAPPRSKKLKATPASSAASMKPAKSKDDFEEAFYSDVSSDSDVDISLAFDPPTSKRKRTNQAQIALAKVVKTARRIVRENDLISTASTLSDQDDGPEDELTSFQQEVTKRVSLDRRASRLSRGGAGTNSSDTSLFDFNTTCAGSKKKATVSRPGPIGSGNTIVRFNMSQLHLQTKRLGIASTADVIGEIASDGGLKVLDCANKDGTVSTVSIPKLDCLPEVVLQKIYRLLFVSEHPVAFDGISDLNRSSALLRVCRKFHTEGTQVLYGANAFHLQRKHATRGKYWEKQWKEIGYKDARRFMEEIGVSNISHLKYVSIELEDAAPGMSVSWTEYQRRFVNDSHLLRVLQLLGENCLLEKFAMRFNNRKTINTNDYLFLKRVSSIKCYDSYLHKGHARYELSTDIKDKLQILMEVPCPEEVDESKKKAPRMMLWRPSFLN